MLRLHFFIPFSSSSTSQILSTHLRHPSTYTTACTETCSMYAIRLRKAHHMRAVNIGGPSITEYWNQTFNSRQMAINFWQFNFRNRRKFIDIDLHLRAMKTNGIFGFEMVERAKGWRPWWHYLEISPCNSDFLEIKEILRRRIHRGASNCLIHCLSCVIFYRYHNIWPRDQVRQLRMVLVDNMLTLISAEIISKAQRTCQFKRGIEGHSLGVWINLGTLKELGDRTGCKEHRLDGFSMGAIQVLPNRRKGSKISQSPTLRLNWTPWLTPRYGILERGRIKSVSQTFITQRGRHLKTNRKKHLK